MAHLIRISLAFCLIFLAACSMLHGKKSSPTCEELKKQMLFTGATSDRTTALQENAQRGGLARAYRNEGC